MHSRAFRILLLALVAVWYGAVLPGHQRGVVQMPGAGADPCCERDAQHESKDSSKAPAPRSCAVCFHMAALEQAAPPDLGIAPLGPTQRQPAAVPPAPVTVHVHATYLGRAPPLA